MGIERQRLQAILSGDLDFHEQSSTYSTHALHAFAAKFPPQLPRTFIEQLTHPGDTVLDPMMGSGTAVLEAMLLGRRAVGVDIDPLAVRLCRVKTWPVDLDHARQAGHACATQAAALLERDPARLTTELARRFDAATRDFLDYWFTPETQHELLALLLSIEDEPDTEVREVLEVVFSSIIITKSGGVSLARDLAHTRPHRVASKTVRSAIEQFKIRLRKSLTALLALPAGALPVALHHADARQLPIDDESVDLVITSPPYANAIDYMRAHKFSLVWFGEPISELSALRSTYIGSDNSRGVIADDLPEGAARCVSEVAQRDRRKARVLQKYLVEMRAALAEMLRVLRTGAAAGIVVGTSTMRGIRVQTQAHLAEISKQLGFDVVGIGKRVLDRNRRMMPARWGNSTMSGIELRMHEEFVIGLVKPG